MTPNGERFYAAWLDEGEEGSDIMFRRMCPVEFPANVIAPEPEAVDGAEEEAVVDDMVDDGADSSED